MKRSLRHATLATTAIVCLAAFSATASAQTAAAAPPLRAAATATAADIANRVETRITDLHARLEATPAQQPQWEAFAQVMRDNAEATSQRFDERMQRMATMTAAENMQSYARFAAEHAKGMQNMVAPFQALYTAMSEAQKRKADATFRDDGYRGEHAGQG